MITTLTIAVIFTAVLAGAGAWVYTDDPGAAIATGVTVAVIGAAYLLVLLLGYGVYETGLP